MWLLLGGLAAGAVHVLSGPDHLAAVAPLAAGSERGAWRAGLRWGLGHVSGVVVVGLLALALRGLLPLERLSGTSERVVGLVLLGIGLWGLYRAFALRVHSHGHGHGVDGEHVHVHVHGPGAAHGRPGAHQHLHAAFGVGILHGLAGSSHLLGVLPALALPWAAALAWLVSFSAGTVAAMAVFSQAVGAVAGEAAARGRNVHRAMMATTGFAAVGIGIFWLVRPV